MSDKAKNKVKNVIKVCLGKYEINEITIICGHKVLYSGSYIMFNNNCDIKMFMYRNILLEQRVLAKDILHNKLFIFLTEDSDISV